MISRLLLTTLLTCSVALAACGGGSGGDSTTAVSATTTASALEKDAKGLDAGMAKDAVGAVGICGPLAQMRLLESTVRRFDAATERLQVSTLGFPDGAGRSLAAFTQRQRTESEDCDVYLAEDAAQVTALAADGGLYDLAPALKDWKAQAGSPAIAPVLVGDRAFGLPIRSGRASGVLVAAVHGRNAGGALEVIRELSGAQRTEAP
ncbi:hypothetical protein AB0L40_08310 [Patulibacter sp. NPDC049589]|uniref:hypothetical protein n=1 Tax=Patulibacter sp. NPDC049589 TaxID=3154731 RepID=UPI003440FCB8